ncbi:hypothetical protein ACVIIW_003636 [Bradyrhizobium sp. USDA 4449]
MATIWVDHSHMARRASGIERVTAELFGDASLAPLSCQPFLAGSGKLSVVSAQMLGLPACAIKNPNDVFVFPGFPPSPIFSMIAHRSVLYVHDLFLLTRREHLNAAGKYYMAPLFGMAIRNFRHFLTNSEDTARKLKSRCSPTASVMTYRPQAKNVFGLGLGDRVTRPALAAKIQAVAVGTIEPRKNMVAAADICSALSERAGLPVELHIIGRRGWGSDADELARRPNVVCCTDSSGMRKRDKLLTHRTFISALPTKRAWGCLCWRFNMRGCRLSRPTMPCSAKFSVLRAFMSNPTSRRTRRELSLRFWPTRSGGRSAPPRQLPTSRVGTRWRTTIVRM